MKRIRSGSTQLFREENPNNRSFISNENADVILTHDTDKAMYAELIDGEWYWVSGCAECIGKPRGTSYIECDEHDVCSCCGISRKEIEGSVWGGRHGWICPSCHDAKKLEARQRAFQKLNGNEPDTHYTDNPTCPHCGTEHDINYVNENTTLECYVCEGGFEIEVNWTPSYTTTVVGERLTH
ncbi:hypothetical protein ORI89_19120 [Sphingobacterium sp. UT-1RO-CII-1]|uniref:hypothetical protein n=1 Tax=Sphingobacterium sp. UT-1RO-CII-1 TaxID=2995225 RepID=UPI00227D3780|nr:hypothetical protein [Sphingobacterium sp. UT-1RO-CII-1]MCY4781766.1 hypothetical protein [Sphingobacterium sp. UT-1RO-CII-1]